MYIYRLITVFTLFLCLVPALWAAPQNNASKEASSKLLDSLRQKLSQAQTSKDSLAILYDLYDLSSRREQKKWAWQIYDVVSRTDDKTGVRDMLCQLAVLYKSSDSVLLRIEQCAKAQPESRLQKQYHLFVQLYQVDAKAKSLKGSQRQEEVMKIFNKEYNGNPADTNSFYDNIRQLYSLCIYLSYTTNGKLYVEYLQRLEELIRQLPEDAYFLRNLFYTRAAIVYTNNGEYDRAIDADRELIRIIGELEKRYAAMGRHYRNYDINYYICYRRMLSNYPALTQKEIKDLYDKCVALAKRNEDVRNDFENNHRARVYYLVAQKKYGAAIPDIKQTLDSADLAPAQRRQMLGLLKEAAIATGDDASLLVALKEYNDVLLQYQQDSYDELYRELQIRYDVNNLIAENMQLELESRETQARNDHIIKIAFIASLVFVLLLLVVISYSFFRTRSFANRLLRLTEMLKQGRRQLIEIQKELVETCERAEEANIAKSNFFHSMSHEVRTPLNAIMGFSQLLVKKIPDEHRGKLEQFTHLITLNTEYLSTLISDILDVSSLESGEMLCELNPVNVHTMANVAVNNMRGRAKAGVTMEFVPSTEDFRISTDRLRVEQVLMNLLSNAAKFTDSGSITLSYRLDDSKRSLMFTVTDTGCGIPAGKEEVIFDRFVKLDPFKQGSGLGLYLCRSVARLLGGDLFVDKLYDKGACFCFTIPINKNS